MRLPPIGFGCSPFRRGQRIDLEGAVRIAVGAGYRLFDVAELYGNERAVGRALREPQAPPRGDLFLVGKVWRTNFRPEFLRPACESSLRRLGIDAFDLYLLHAPGAWRYRGPLEEPDDADWESFERRAIPRDALGEVELDRVSPVETWEAMQELRRLGLVGSIGVSNFEAAQVEELGPDLPAVNQIAISPYRPSVALVDWCGERRIRVMAHSPLSPEGLLSDPRLLELATRCRRSPAQIVLRWQIEKGVVPLPSSVDPGRIVENLAALEFELEEAALAAVDALADGAEGAG